MASVRLGPERLRDPSRIGEPRNETDQKALANLLSALKAEAEARLGCAEPSRLESLLHSGEGTDVVVHTQGVSGDGLRLHSGIARLSSPLFAREVSNLHLNWTEPAANAVAIFMYTGRVVVPTHLLSETYRAAREAGMRSLCCLLRTYAYYPLRLTSADHARHIRRFATQAGLSRLRSLADHYIAHLASVPSTVTLVIPVHHSWASKHRSLPLGRHCVAVAFKHRPPFEHESSASLVLRAADAPNVCVRIPCDEPGSNSNPAHNGVEDEANGRLDGTNGSATGSDGDASMWLYVTCPKREAAEVLHRLLSEVRKGCDEGSKDEGAETWTLMLERGEVQGESPSELESMLAPETNGHANSLVAKGKVRVGVSGPSAETLARVLAAADTVHYCAKEGKVQLVMPSLAAAKETLRRLGGNNGSEAAQEYGYTNGRISPTEAVEPAMRGRTPQAEVKIITPLV